MRLTRLKKRKARKFREAATCPDGKEKTKSPNNVPADNTFFSDKKISVERMPRKSAAYFAELEDLNTRSNWSLEEVGDFLA